MIEPNKAFSGTFRIDGSFSREIVSTTYTLSVHGVPHESRGRDAFFSTIKEEIVGMLAKYAEGKHNQTLARDQKISNHELMTRT